MKQKLLVLYRYLPWLLLLLVIDGLAALLLWLSDADAFFALNTVMLLSTILLFAAVFFILLSFDRKRKPAFQAFLNTPDLFHEENLIKTLHRAEADSVRLLGQTLREKENARNLAEAGLNSYEEYVEAWAHETKTPLSLLTLVLDNHEEELPASVRFKLDYARSRMQEYINQMLYYARLGSARKDYFFESLDLCTCIEDVLEDYKPLLKEQQFLIRNLVPETWIFTDDRGIHFLLSQIISNSIKYCTSSADANTVPTLTFTLTHSEELTVLSIRDNGIGVRNCDLPYIFEKGFTGASADTRKKATGMGLYLSQKIADDLNIVLDARSEWGKGFEMTVSFYCRPF